MEDRTLKSIIFSWLAIMCTMDYFFPLGNWQTRLLMWGINGLFFAVWAALNISQKRVFTPFREKGILIIIYLFLLLICVSAFLSQEPFLGIKQIFPLLVGLLDTYIFYDFFSRSRKNVQFFVKIITFFTLFVSGWAVLEALQKISTGESLFKSIYAGFCNQNFLGYFLFLFTPLMVSYYLINSPFHGKYRGWRLIFLLVLGYALILSSSRSSWNGVMMAIFFLLFRKSKALGIGTLFLITILGLSIYVFSGGGIYRHTWQEVYADRAVAWDAAWKVISEHPFRGIGWGVTPEGSLHAHSIYMSNAAQLGIFSLILLLAFYVVFLHGSAQIEKEIRDPHLKAILLGSTATYFGQIFYSLTDLSGILVAFSATSIAFLPYILIALPLAIKSFCPPSLRNNFHDRKSNFRI